MLNPDPSHRPSIDQVFVSIATASEAAIDSCCVVFDDLQLKATNNMNRPTNMGVAVNAADAEEHIATQPDFLLYFGSERGPKEAAQNQNLKQIRFRSLEDLQATVPTSIEHLPPSQSTKDSAVAHGISPFIFDPSELAV